MKPASYLFVILSFFGIFCTKEQLPPADVAPAIPVVKKTYVIKNGMHYSDQNDFQVLDQASISANVTFNQSAIYTSNDPVNQADVNKLIGFSDCSTEHQQNSARLGWSWNGTGLVIYAYAYVNKIRVIKTLRTVALDKPFACSVKAIGNQYVFTVDDAIDSIPRNCTGYPGSRYKLFPYFGGDETAPHEISIEIEETLK